MPLINRLSDRRRQPCQRESKLPKTQRKTISLTDVNKNDPSHSHMIFFLFAFLLLIFSPRHSHYTDDGKGEKRARLVNRC